MEFIIYVYNVYNSNLWNWYIIVFMELELLVVIYGTSEIYVLNV